MKIDKFKVCFCKKDVLYFMTFLIITLIACIFIFFNENYRGISIFGMIFTTSVILFFITNIVFRLEVENNYFRIRTKFGKNYEFNLSEIEKIFCIKRTGIKMGNNFYIKIYAKDHLFEVNNTMEGFETLAEYFLQMYINDELYENVLSKNTIQQLKFYASKQYKNI